MSKYELCCDLHKSKKKGAQNSADSNHKDQNYPNCFDLEIKEKITYFFNK